MGKEDFIKFKISKNQDPESKKGRNMQTIVCLLKTPKFKEVILSIRVFFVNIIER